MTALLEPLAAAIRSHLSLGPGDVTAATRIEDLLLDSVGLVQVLAELEGAVGGPVDLDGLGQTSAPGEPGGVGLAWTSLTVGALAERLVPSTR